MMLLRPQLLLLLALLPFAGCSVDFHVGARPAVVGPDGGPATDAGPSDAEAGIAHFCSGVLADFCADFETGGVESGWDNQITNGGLVELDPNHGSGSARSAVFRLPIGADAATLVRKLSGPWRPTTVEFDTFVATPTSNDPIALMQLMLTSDASGTSVGAASFLMFVTPLAVTLQVWTPNEHARSLTTPFPYDRWVHVTFTVNWETKSATIALDRTPAVAYDDFPSSVQVGSAFETILRLGAVIGSTQSAPVPTVHHDNVVMLRERE